jgi:hypothetical protein
VLVAFAQSKPTSSESAPLVPGSRAAGPLGHYGDRMKHLDAIAGEVVGVERQYLRNAMDIHRGDKPCVMNLAAYNAVLHDQALPLDIDSGSVRKPD